MKVLFLTVIKTQYSHVQYEDIVDELTKSWPILTSICLLNRIHN